VNVILALLRSTVVVLLFSSLCPGSLAQVREQREISYGSAPQQKLDLFLPPTKAFPTVLFVHGGSLDSGDKADDVYKNVCRGFPAAGIACASANYRLVPASWPAPAEDVAAATAWIVANIGRHGGDPTKIFLVGHSSGAQLVALLGADRSYLAKQGVALTAIRGVVPMGSIMWDEELETAARKVPRERVNQAFSRGEYRPYSSYEQYLSAWPMKHVRAGMPRYLFPIAAKETEQPPILRHATLFLEEIKKYGGDGDYAVFAGRNHNSMVAKLHEPSDPVFQHIVEFVRALSTARPEEHETH